MLQFIVLFLASALFALGESSPILDKVGKKCPLGDDECKQVLFKAILDEIAENGIPEFNVPILDPLVIKDQSFDILGLLKFTVLEGDAKGLKDCYASSFKSDLSNQRIAVEFTCERFLLEGTYKLESTPALLAVIGGINIHGEGKGSVAFEKLHLTLDFAFEVKKLADGELHLLIVPDDSIYDYEVTGKVEVAADHILVGKQEISNVLVNIANENWEALVNTLGRPIADKSLQVFYDNILKFLTEVPVKDFISGDLTPYLKN